MKSKLEDICSYRKEKVLVSDLTPRNYISTENMLANKAGITTASALPSVAKVQKFLPGDVLVSNIRPYFKKIWFADKTGGCSNDVLVFSAKAGVNKKFLYYVLANDSFFDYSMATAKGTKMPRGDKAALLDYGVPDYESTEQNTISSFLFALDEKIQVNKQINKNLAA